MAGAGKPGPPKGRRPRPPARRGGGGAGGEGAGPPAEPGRGRLPTPSPATVFERPVPASLVDSAGAGIGITDRGGLTAVPRAVAVDGGPPHRVLDWAGPWLVDTE